MDIHTRIKALRTHLNLSHQQLADRISELEELKKPLSWQTVQQWENGKSAPKRSRLAFVAMALGVELPQLMGYEAMPAGNVLFDTIYPAGTQPPKPVAAKESERPYKVGWPFKVITNEQLTQLPSAQLDELERVIVEHLMNPLNLQWRRIARDLAAEIDHRNHDDQLSNFCRAVDLKAQTLRAAQLQEPASA